MLKSTSLQLYGLPEVRIADLSNRAGAVLERVLGLKIDYAHLSYDGSLLGMTSFVEVMVDVMTADFEEEHILWTAARCW